MTVYHLKHATPRMKYLHMTNRMAWNADLKDKQLNPPDRHVALADIKEMMGSDFHAWYDEVYKLRAANQEEEYEAAIFEKLYQLTEHPANVAYDMEVAEAQAEREANEIRNDTEDCQTTAIKFTDELDEMEADWHEQISELRGGG